MARVDVRARMQEPARVEQRLRELLVGGGLLVAVVHDGGEAAVARCAERDALDRVRPVADAVIHLAPRQHQLDRAASRRGRRAPPASHAARCAAPSRRRRRRRARRRGRSRAGMPNTAAISSADVVHPLRLVPQRQAVAVPRRDRRVHLDRIVVLARDHIGLVDLDLGGRERSFGIAAPRLRRPALALVGLLLRRQAPARRG